MHNIMIANMLIWTYMEKPKYTNGCVADRAISIVSTWFITTFIDFNATIDSSVPNIAVTAISITQVLYVKDSQHYSNVYFAQVYGIILFNIHDMIH